MTIGKIEQRQLKFRAWSNKFNKFLATGFHIIGECTLFDILNQHRVEELDTLIIQQWTGFADKNKNDIYEGDIIDCYEIDEYQKTERKNCIVIFQHGSFYYGMKKENGHVLSHRLLLYANNIKVVGNILEDA